MYFNKDDSKILRKIDDILTVIKRKCILKVVFLTKKCNSQDNHAENNMKKIYT